MIKSFYNDPAFQDHGFIKHVHHCLVDMGIYPDGQPLFEMYKIIMIDNPSSIGSTGGKPRNLALCRKVLGPHQDPSSGAWDVLRVWHGDGTGDYDDASAAGSVTVNLTTGDVHVLMSFGKKNSAGVIVFQEWEETIARGTFAPAVVRPPITGTPGVKGDKGDKGDPGPKGDPGSTGTGSGISPEDAELLTWLRSYRKVLHDA